MAKQLIYSGGGSKSSKPYPDTFKTKDTVELILGLGEGPWWGPAEGAKSIYLDQTPLVNSAGFSNFKNMFVAFYPGSDAGEEIRPRLGGFSSPVAVQVNLEQNVAVTRTGLQTELDFIELRLVIQALYKNDEKKGALPTEAQVKVEYKRTDAATWSPAFLYTEPTPASATGPNGSTVGYAVYDPNEVTDAVGNILTGSTPPGAPLSPRTVWLNSSDNYRPHTWNGSSWVSTAVYDSLYYRWSFDSVFGFGPTNYVNVPVGDDYLALSANIGDVAIVPGSSSPTIYNGDGWVVATPAYNTTNGVIRVNEKISAPTVKEFRFPVPNVEVTYDVRVTMLTEDTSEARVAEIQFESFQEVKARPYTFPGTACLQFVAQASDQFSSQPTIQGIYKGAIVRVPTNYNPETRAYTGVWDGTFKLAWTDNPAWLFMHFVENTRYGLSRVYPHTCNKFSIYEWAQYCDALVPDGKGGTRPRWTFNQYIRDARDAKEFAQFLAGAAGARYLDDGNGFVDVIFDNPADQPVALFVNENVEEGLFNYSFTDRQSRANRVVVKFNNEDLFYRTDTRVVEDLADQEIYGVIPDEFIAEGCRNVSEALARARLRLITNLTEREFVSFRTQRKGRYLRPWDIILIADAEAGYGISGRLKSVNGARTVTLDQAITLEPGIEYKITFDIVNPAYSDASDPAFVTVERVINTAPGTVTQVTVTEDLPLLPEASVFSLGSVETLGLPKAYRVLKIEADEADEDKVSIEAMEINRSKYAYIDGTSDILEEDDYRAFYNGVIPAVTGLRARATRLAGSRNIIVTWDESPSKYVKRYRVSMAKAGALVQTLGETTGTQFEIENVGGYAYEIYVTPIDFMGREGSTSAVRHDLTAVTRYVPAPGSVSLLGGGTIVTTPDITIRWSPHVEVEPLFSHYEVRVFEGDGVTLRRSVEVGRLTEWTYSVDDQLEDGAARGLVFMVRSVDSEGSTSIDQSLVVSKPAPSAPVLISEDETFVGTQITIQPSGLPDAQLVAVFLGGATVPSYFTSQLSILVTAETQVELAFVDSMTLYLEDYNKLDLGVVEVGDLPPGPPGPPGVDGADGRSVAQLIVYRRAAAPPSTPTGGSFDFGTNSLVPPTDWSAIIPTGNDPCYVSMAIASAEGTDGVDSGLTWSSPTVLVRNGLDGSQGAAGKSVYSAIVFRRSATAPAAPNGGSFNFGTNTLTPPTDWFLDVPAGSDPVYGARFVFSILGDTGVVNATSWSTPFKIAQDGIAGLDGSPGADGISTFQVTVYRRAASAPGTPTGGQYNFGTQTLTPPSGWSMTVPAGDNPLYVSTSLASTLGVTGIDNTLTWTAPVIIAKNGADGADGADGAPGADGERGSKSFFANGSVWSDTTANNAITSAGYTKVVGDQVTIASPSAGFAESRRWSGAAWVYFDQVLHGNLFVDGTLLGRHLASESIDATKFSSVFGTLEKHLRVGTDGSGSDATFIAGNGYNTTHRIWVGGLTPETASFSISKEGKVSAQALEIYKSGELVFSDQVGFTDFGRNLLLLNSATLINPLVEALDNNTDFIPITLTENTTVKYGITIPARSYTAQYAGGWSNSPLSPASPPGETFPSSITVAIQRAAAGGSYTTTETVTLTKGVHYEVISQIVSTPQATGETDSELGTLYTRGVIQHTLVGKAPYKNASNAIVYAPASGFGETISVSGTYSGEVRVNLSQGSGYSVTGGARTLSMTDTSPGIGFIRSDTGNVGGNISDADLLQGQPGSYYLNAANLTGTVPTARLGSGTANGSTFLRGDGVWASISLGAINISDVGGLQSALDGKRSLGDTTFGADLWVSKGNSTPKQFVMATSGSVRWAVASNGDTESGSNSGSTFVIARFNDSGNYVDAPFAIARNTGIAYFTQTPFVDGHQVWHAGNFNPNTKSDTNHNHVVTALPFDHAYTGVPSGVTVFEAGSGSGYPASFTALMTVKHSNNRQWQMHADNTRMYFRRGHVDSTGGTGPGWSPWNEVATLNNPCTVSAAWTFSQGQIIGGPYGAGSLGYSDTNWGYIFRPPRAGVQAAHRWDSFGGSPLMRLLDTGELGIGRAPVSGIRVEVDGDVRATGSYRLTAGDGSGIRFWDTGSAYSICMSSSGNATWGGRVAGETTSDYNMYFRMGGGSNRGFVFKNGDNVRAGIDGAGNFRTVGNVTAYSSDARLKLNQNLIQNPLEKLEQLGGYTFDWDMEKCEQLGFKPSNVHEHGVLAQEIQKIVPDAVTTAPFSEEYLTVHYDRLVPLLIEAVKELSARVKKLEGEE